MTSFGAELVQRREARAALIEARNQARADSYAGDAYERLKAWIAAENETDAHESLVPLRYFPGLDMLATRDRLRAEGVDAYTTRKHGPGCRCTHGPLDTWASGLETSYCADYLQIYFKLLRNAARITC